MSIVVQRVLIGSLVAGMLLAPSAAVQAQEAGPQGGEPAAEPAAGEEADALVRRIQTSLAEVDAALQAAAEEPAVAQGVSTARRKHLEVIRDIEALIKQIKYQECNNPGGSGSGNSASSGEEPSSSKPSARPSDGSQAPTPKGGKQEQKPGGEQQEPAAGARPAGAEPRDDGPGGNRPGTRVPPDETGRFTRTDTDARWGLLPPKLQERLMNLHVDDVPERYRAWLEAYIKALNAREQEGRGR